MYADSYSRLARGGGVQPNLLGAFSMFGTCENIRTEISQLEGGRERLKELPGVGSFSSVMQRVVTV